MKSPQRAQWIAAMCREKDCHIKNGTFGKDLDTAGVLKPIPADWVFRIKHRGGPVDVNTLSAKQFKARVVVRGQYMKEGLNFNDTYAPVAKPTTLRAVLAFATKYSLSIMAGDIETAFLTASMDCEAWVKMPPFWGAGSDPVTDCNPQLKPKLLVKGVPGIPQGSRLFYLTFAAHLSKMGYKPSEADMCLFFCVSLKERHALLVWVDDFIFVYENEATFTHFLKALREAFTIPVVGNLNSFLGMV
jgi:hypothetical protein